jgi:hypothetical protein
MEGRWQSFESQVFVDELHTVFHSIEELYISFMWDATLIQTCKNLKCSHHFLYGLHMLVCNTYSDLLKFWGCHHGLCLTFGQNFTWHLTGPLLYISWTAQSFPWKVYGIVLPNGWDRVCLNKISAPIQTNIFKFGPFCNLSVEEYSTIHLL